MPDPNDKRYRTPVLSNEALLRRIEKLLDGTEWDSDTFDAIRDVMVAAGFTIRDPASAALRCPKCDGPDVRLMSREIHSYPYATVRDGLIRAGHGSMEECEVYFWCPVCQEEVTVELYVEWAT